MKSVFKTVIICEILVVNIFAVYSQPNPIGLGWAKNSVNGTIFRKNSVTSFKGNQVAAYYDSLGYVVLAKRKLGTENWVVNKTQYTGNVEDAHDIISVAIDGNGYVHMAWDHHGHPLRYCMSADSLSLTLGNKKSMVGTLEDVVTYPEFFRMPNGDLTFIYRDGWSGNANCVINKYSAEEKKWIRLHDNLISGENARSAYWQSFVDKNGVIHVSWVWRESSDVASNHDMCYAKSSDGGVTWYNSKDEQYTIPIVASTAEKVCVIPQNSELINQTSIYATTDSKPYIASYWTEEITNRVQYQLIYLDQESNWQQKSFSNRSTTFSLSGAGTKKIPISRPQVMVDESGDKNVVYMIYRDNNRGSKVSMNVCYDMDTDTIEVHQYDITDFSVDDWEPTYDIDLWKDSAKLDIFVQRMQQGDGETLSDLPAQPVYVWRINDNLIPSDTIYSPVKAAVRAFDPNPENGSRRISVDAVLNWVSRDNTTLHKLFMGTSSQDLKLVAEINENFYQPENLLPYTKYYWRIDEVLDEQVTTGDIWSFITGAVMGMNSFERNQNAGIYPQPTTDFINIPNLDKPVKIDIYNLEGKKLLSEFTNGMVNVENLNNGFYILKMEDEITRFTKYKRD